MVINLRLKCFAHAGGMTVIELWQHGKIECAISDLPNLLKCVEACGSNNFGCMGKCTGVRIQDPSLPPPPPLPVK